MNVHVCLTVEAKLRRVATNKRTFFEINNLQNLKNSIKSCPPVFYGITSMITAKILKSDNLKRLYQ